MSTKHSLLSSFVGAVLLATPVCLGQVVAITPGCGPTAGGTSISITGANFVGITSATIGGAPILNLSVVNAGLITGQTPPGSTGAKDVTVCNAQGCSTLAGGFTYLPAGAANLLFDGSFELVTPTEYFGGSSIPGWSVLGDGIDVYGNFWIAADGQISIDLNKSDAGAVEQTFTTTPGSNYLVVFSMAANVALPPAIKQLQVTAAGQAATFTFNGTGWSNQNMGWACKSWTFTAASSSTALRFTSQTSGPCGPALDGVAVYELTTLTAPSISPIGGPISYGLLMPPTVPYVFDVSTTGTSPGFTINPGNHHVSLNAPFLNMEFGAAIPPGVFINFVGLSNAVGGATTLVNLPNLPQLIGINLSAVFGYLDPLAPSGIGGVSNPVTTLITGPAPIINSVIPASGVQTGGTSIQIAGANFQAGATVKIGGTTATGIVVTPTLITCATPSGPVGPASVQVTNPDTLSVTLAGGFTYVATLVVSSVSPAAAATGATVTVTGSGIQAGATVSVGGVAASVQTSTATSLSFTNPPGIPCSTTVVVTNPDNQVASIGFNPTPTISSIFGSSGPAAGGGSMVIFGTQFLAGTTVTVGGTAATINAQSQTSLFCTVPPGAVGPAQIVVSSVGGCTATGTYTYQ